MTKCFNDILTNRNSIMELNTNSVWTITQPFDTLLFKYWPYELVRRLELSLNCDENYAIVEALCPNINEGGQYFTYDILHRILENFQEKPNLCDVHKYCQDVVQHSVGFGCVTAAGIRKRILDYFNGHLNPLDNKVIHQQVIRHARWNCRRKNLGVLVFDFPRDLTSSASNDLRNHAMQVLYDNFYLYTTPKINNDFMNEKINFIIKQISRNTNCVIIFADEDLALKWRINPRALEDIFKTSLAYDHKIKVIIISLNSETDFTASEIFTFLLMIKPVIVFSHQITMAPSGGLIATVKRACKLSAKNTVVKYWYRGIEVFFNSFATPGTHIYH